jgi:hypothetical protein
MTRLPRNYWSTVQTRALRLEVATVLLVLTTAGLAGWTIWEASRPLPIYYVPASGAPGFLYPDEVPDALAADLAQEVVLLLYNITPATVTAAHQTVAKYLHPSALVPFQVQAEQERQRVMAETLSAQLAIRDVQVHREQTQRHIVLTAMRRVYVGKLPVRDEEVEAAVTLLPVRPSALNPYGLVVTDLRITPRLTADTVARR